MNQDLYVYTFRYRGVYLPGTLVIVGDDPSAAFELARRELASLGYQAESRSLEMISSEGLVPGIIYSNDGDY